MTKDEALKLALEALENHCGNYKLDDAGYDRHDKAITTIKEALAQPAQEPVGYVYSEAGLKSAAIQRDLPNGTPLYAAPLPAQEPVAWIGDDGNLYHDYEKPHEDYGPEPTPLYTAPQQRPWVSLTDNEIESALGNYQGWREFARHLENILKEKND